MFRAEPKIKGNAASNPVTSAPSLVHCLVVAERVTNRETGHPAADSVLVHCDSDDDHVVYTNIHVSRVQVGNLDNTATSQLQYS